jgi:hypothetical protein
LSTTIGYVSGLSSSGSGPPRTPVSSASIAATSVGSSAKSKTSKLSAMLCAFTDFGIAQKPCSMCQRRTICAGVLPRPRSRGRGRRRGTSLPPVGADRVLEVRRHRLVQRRRRAADALADLALVVVGSGRVDQAVALAQRRLDGGDGLLGRALEHAEA